MARHLRLACSAIVIALILASCSSHSGSYSDCSLYCLDSTPPPMPSISSLAPDSAIAGGPTFTLTVSGANFNAASSVELTGGSSSQSLVTTYIAKNTLHVAVPAAAIASAGSFQVTVSNSASLVSAPAPFTVVSEPDFTLSALPSSIMIRPGNPGTVSVAVQPLAGFTGLVSLSIASLPAGVTASFSPTTITQSGTATLTLSASTTAATTDAPVALRVDGSSASIVHSADLQLSVLAPEGVEVISSNDLGVLSNDVNDDISLSNDGRYAAFKSHATNLVAPPTQQGVEVFVHDDCIAVSDCTATTRLASAVTATNVEGDKPGDGPTAISADGRFVGFQSDATNLAGGAAANFPQLYVRDSCAGAPNGCVPATRMVSLTAAGTEPNKGSQGITMSSDSRYVAFQSDGTNLVTGSTIAGQVYSRDTCRTTTGPVAGCSPVTILVSADSDGNPGDLGTARWLSMSANGRFVAFASLSSNLPGGSSMLTTQAYLRDTCINVPACLPSTTIVSVDNTGNVAPHGDYTGHPSISGDGRFVVFVSRDGLAPGSSLAVGNIFIRDTCRSEAGQVDGCTPATSTVTETTDGSAANNDSALSSHSISASGRYVLFVSTATNLVAGVGTQFGVYVRDTCAGITAGCTPLTRLISVDRNGAFIPARLEGAAISPDGHYGAFVVYANSGPNSDQALLVPTGF